MYRPCLLAVAMLLFFDTSLVCGQDADAIRTKLEQAKQGYEKIVDEQFEAVLAFFDKQEESARKSGNKKEVDRIKAERTSFTQSGEFPQSVPVTIQRKLAAAQKSLENAYSVAIKDFTKANFDDDAALTEKALEEFRTEKTLGWTSLFNGRNTDGWIQSEASQATWSVNDGVLTGRGGLGYLLTERNDLQNFRLRLQARVDNSSDSGLCFRIQDNKVSQAYEAQFGTLPNTGSLILFQNGNHMLASSTLQIPQKEWIDLELLANGRDITIWINGKQSAEYKIPEAKGRLWSGRIGLQQNGRQSGASVQFRKVMIKVLPST